jgi:hypothetical protein
MAVPATGNPGIAYRLFLAALDREPNPYELGYQVARLDGGLTPLALAQEYVASPEFTKHYGLLTNANFVTAMYEDVLHRGPDSAGLAYIAGRLDAGTMTRADVLLGFAQSPEDQAAVALATQATGISYVPTQVGTAGPDVFTADPAVATAIDGGAGIDTAVFPGLHTDYDIFAPTFAGDVSLTSVERLQFSDVTVAIDIGGNAGDAYRLYFAALGRAPDQAGLTFQVHALDNGATWSQVAANFLASPEFAAKYGTLDNTQFVTLLYHNALQRDPDTDGLAFHVGHLDAGMITRADLLVEFAESEPATLLGAIQHGIVLGP